MFTPSPIKAKLNQEILLALKELEQYRDDPERTDAIIDRMSKLHKLKSEERFKPPSFDTMLTIAANIFGIILLTRYERENVINSKAINFVLKPR